MMFKLGIIDIGLISAFYNNIDLPNQHLDQDKENDYICRNQWDVINHPCLTSTTS